VPASRHVIQTRARAAAEQHHEVTAVRKDGTTFPAELHSRLAPWQGRLLRVASIRDITERKQAEEALRRQNEELAALHDTTLGLINQLDPTQLLEAIIARAAALIGTPHGYLYVVDPARQVMITRLGSGVFARQVGYEVHWGEGLSGRVWATGAPVAVDDYNHWPGHLPDREALGMHAIVGIPLRSGAEVVGVIGLAFAEPGRRIGADEIALLTRFGQLASLALENARLYAAAQQELTDRKRAEETMAYLALHDSLTDLPNRTLLHERLRQALLAARRADQTLALLVMDMDRFKEVNDTLGHYYGDVLLRQVGERLRAALRASDTVARLGGDEFAVLLPGADPEGAHWAARKLLSALERPFELEGHTLDVRVSIGMALYPEHGADAETLLRRADVAMYIAKRGGLGYAMYTSDQDPYSPTRLALIGDLRRAIEQEELVLYYQPKISYRTGRVTGVEALVRWPHPLHGLLPPEQFIPLAEQMGLIQPLSRCVLNLALRQCRAWHDAGLVLPVAVNLSLRDLHDARLPDQIGQLLDVWALPPALLHIEITEDAAMAEPGRTLGVLTWLRGLGVHLAIDDFGTGQSSLAQLKRLPVDQLKIDKSFVREMTASDNDAVIVRSIIDLGHNLGLTVVAEGVEDAATAALLTTLGCDEGQGYYLSPAIPPDALTGWLAEREAFPPAPDLDSSSLLSFS
jgi:diguanylate cyclase (GGDEF)-like protein